MLVGTAFSAMAALLAVHGLSTPGILLGPNGLVSFAGGATLPVGAAVLGLAAVPGLQRRGGVRVLLLLQAALLVSIVGLGALGAQFPSLIPAVPRPSSGPALTLLLIGLALSGLLALRAATRRSLPQGR